jgi:hypothetical protein
METTEKNRLIAQFMECEPRTDAVDDRVLAYYIGDVIINADNSKNENDENVFHPDDMKFHTDWNWLMPVIRKIEELGNDVLITTNYIQISFDEGEQFIVIDDLNIKIDSVYNAVVEFIKWYNENK